MLVINKVHGKLIHIIPSCKNTTFFYWNKSNYMANWHHYVNNFMENMIKIDHILFTILITVDSLLMWEDMTTWYITKYNRQRLFCKSSRLKIMPEVLITNTIRFVFIKSLSRLYMTHDADWGTQLSVQY